MVLLSPRRDGIRPETAALLGISPSSLVSFSPSFADFSWKHFLDKSLAHKFSSLGLLLETWSKTKGASWLNLPPASRAR